MAIESRRGFLRSATRAVTSALTYPLLSWLASCRGHGSARGSGRESSTQEPASGESTPKARIDPTFEPGYLALHRSGELRRRGETLWEMMRSCELCPRRCTAARLDGERGFCHASDVLEIASHHPHFGEERPLVGRGGSGTVFLSNCNLRCVFCINWEISQGGVGVTRSLDDLAEMMLNLQRMGCHNINVVTPTHYSAHIARALDLAAARGLRLPLVYNTCGWERAEVLRLLAGVVDIYLPDFKYWDRKMAARFSSGAEDYPKLTRDALLEMHRQVGVARPASDGLMYRGLMIRHLVMPNGVSGSRELFRWIATHLPRDTYVNIMSQYRPAYRALDYPRIARRLTREEYRQAVTWAREAGLTNLDVQGWWGHG